jgi:hypothetical protein
MYIVTAVSLRDSNVGDIVTRRAPQNKHNNLNPKFNDNPPTYTTIVTLKMLIVLRFRTDRTTTREPPKPNI